MMATGRRNSRRAETVAPKLRGADKNTHGTAIAAFRRHSYRGTPVFETEDAGRTHGAAIAESNAWHSFAEAIPTSKGAIRTLKGEIGYWRWGSSDMTLPTSTVMELKGCQRE